MKLETFKKLFPAADMSMFSELEGVVVYDKLDDVEEPSFWDNEEAVFDLHLPYDDLVSYYQNKKRYIEKFREKLKLLQAKKIIPKPSWIPKEFGLNVNPVPPIKLKNQKFDFENFRIYVTPDDFFMLHDSFKDFGNVKKIDFKDEKNIYCLSLKIFYILSYLGGMSTENLKSENNFAKSLSYFYFYYHLKKFLNYRDFSAYDTEPVENIESFNSIYNWTTHHVYYHPQIHYTEAGLKRTKDDVIKNIHRKGKWVYYQTRLGKRNMSQDYLKLIQSMGNGLTKTGQLLFQESCQAYVYAVLGAQAKTHWKIIGDGTNSLQTQNVFHTLVNEIIAQNNLSTLIKSMRLAIHETKVRLDFCISPGLELLPSQMIYIKDSPGYNNVLLISDNHMKFGSNSSVNNVEKRIEYSPPPEKEVKESPKNEIQKYSPPTEVGQNSSVVISSFVVAVFMRLAWLAL